MLAIWIIYPMIYKPIIPMAQSKYILATYSPKPGRVNKHRIILSWIANMAGFLWLRFSKSLQRNGYHFINGYDLFYNGRNSPESLQAYDPALGGYIIQVGIRSNTQVSCRCKHAAADPTSWAGTCVATCSPSWRLHHRATSATCLPTWHRMHRWPGRVSRPQ